MKRRLLIVIVVLVGFGIILSSCKDILNKTPHGSLNEEVLNNKKGAETLLIGAYSALDGQNVGGGAADLYGATSPRNWIYGSIAGGDAHKGSDPGDQSVTNLIGKGRSNPSMGFFNSKWKANYEGISRANAVLEVLKTAEDISGEAQKRIAAEARFLRGHYYFDLKRMFNKVPWIDENTTSYNQPNDTNIWPKIEADFEFAKDNLPATQSDVGRANRWAAASYLAKTYVYQKKWRKAKTLFDDIIANGVTSSGEPYALVDGFKDIFAASNKNHSGSIFAVQMTANDGTGTIYNSNRGIMLAFPFGGPFGCCGLYQPSQALVNSYQTNASGLPMPNSYNNTKVKSDQGLNSDDKFTPYNGSLDPRLDWTVGRRGIPYHDWGPFPGKSWIRNQSYAGPYHGKKHVYWQSTEDQYHNPNSFAPGSALNYHIIRFADVLLMAAEAEVALGNLENARQLTNRVRSRVVDSDGWVDNDLNKAFAHAVVNNKAAMLNSGATSGDWVVRTDRNSTFVLLEGNSANISNWQEYKNPANNYNISIYPAGHSAFQTKSAAQEAVHFERKLELAMEGYRFFDLVRWGEAEEKLNDFYQYEGSLFPDVRGGEFTPNKNEYYPIPQRQIDLSVVNGEAVLQQNTGYN